VPRTHIDMAHLPAPSAAAWTLLVAMLSRIPKDRMAKRLLPDQSSQLAKTMESEK